MPSMESKKDNPRDQLEALLERLGAKVQAADDWGEKKLAYQIDGHEKGYYVVYQVEMKPEKDREFKSRIKLIKGILRYLLVHTS